MLVAELTQHVFEAARIALQRGDQRGLVPVEFREKLFRRNRDSDVGLPTLAAFLGRH
jgi:hypothetical protein